MGGVLLRGPVAVEGGCPANPEGMQGQAGMGMWGWETTEGCRDMG